MTAEPVVLRLSENQTLVTDAVTPAHAALLQEHYKRFIDVQPAWGGGISLTAKQYIGAIAAPGLRIHIEPKVPLTNLFFMLAYAYDLPEFRREETPLAVGEDIVEFLIRVFVDQVDQLVRHGIYRGYLDYERNRRYLCGRLLLASHLQRNAIQLHRFHQRTNEFTADLLENQILKFTLWLLVRAGYGSGALQRLLRRSYSAFSEVAHIHVTPADCDRVTYTRLNSRYYTPIQLAQLFIQHLSVEGHAGDTPFLSYLMPMYRVFELFVGRYLAEHFAGSSLHEVELQPQIWLDRDHKEQGFPDIVLYRAGRPLLVLDTKYKVFHGSPGRDDRNQMLVYCHTMDINHALLIYADDAAPPYRAVFRGKVLDVKTLPLDGSLDAFKQTCRQFASALERQIV